jgi:hypothetical protein
MFQEGKHTNISLTRVRRQHNPIPPIPPRLLKAAPFLRPRHSLFLLIRGQTESRDTDTRTRRQRLLTKRQKRGHGCAIERPMLRRVCLRGADRGDGFGGGDGADGRGGGLPLEGRVQG